jgi:hypothetical protein
MDALGIIYPQYWTEAEADSNFEAHLKIIKAHYGHSKPFSTAQFPDGSVDPISHNPWPADDIIQELYEGERTKGDAKTSPREPCDKVMA